MGQGVRRLPASPHIQSAAAEPSGAPAWKTIPSGYLRGTTDNVIPPAQQRAMAENAQRHNKRHNHNPCGDQKMLTGVTVMKKLKA